MVSDNRLTFSCYHYKKKNKNINEKETSYNFKGNCGKQKGRRLNVFSPNASMENQRSKGHGDSPKIKTDHISMIIL